MSNRKLTIEYEGQAKTISEWAEETGLSYALIRSRYFVCKWSARDTLKIPKSDIPGYTYTYNGQTKTLREWADHLGVKYNTLYTRILVRKWSIEKALSTKPTFRRPRAKKN